MDPSTPSPNLYVCQRCGAEGKSGSHCSPEWSGCDRSAGSGPDDTVLKLVTDTPKSPEKEIMDGVEFEGEPGQDPDATDRGNARRFVGEHGDDLIYIYPWNEWYVWDKARWKSCLLYTSPSPRDRS